MSDLDQKLSELARVPVLLVASDYDGTLSPIVDDPAQAKPEREAIVALRSLASLPQTHVAVISGRALRDLASLTGLPEDVHLVGSHGSEFDPDFAHRLPPETAALRNRVLDELREIAARSNGLAIEEKPASIAFHFRNAQEQEADQAVRQVLEGPAAIEGVFTKHGKKVIELGVVTTNKGEALERIRHRVGASAVLFLGDDVTDEDAFATLKGPDLAIKIGDGESLAPFRIADPVESSRVLAHLCELRSAWLEGADAIPIAHHALLSDQRTCALVTPTGRITWLCLPRLDSPALFAELLGGEAAGHFSIFPADGGETPQQRYAGESLILHTEWSNLTVTDFLDCADGRSTQRAGRTDLVRIIEGSTSTRIEFAPRLDFGRVSTKLRRRDDGLEIVETPHPIVLRSPGIQWEIVEEGRHHTARAIVDPGVEPIVLELRYGTGSLREASISGLRRQQLTMRYWEDWADGLRLPHVERTLCRRSALTLKALTYGPSGAIAAAATTSLPEHIGGVRNWDYRYCWPRDAAMAASALVKIGSKREAMQLLDWLLNVLDECMSPEQLLPVYTLTGAELPSEAEITELAGYRGSRPVRVSNAAGHQVQLDVFGPITQLIADLAAREAPLSSEHWRIVEAMVQAVERRWEEPDHGIWEIRKPRRHHVYSKVMCWLTVDRAIAIGRQLLDREQDGWATLRETIRHDILEHGWHEEVGAFTAAYDEPDLDASALWVGLSGMLSADDDRFVRTIDRVEQYLRSGSTVYRYHADDGLPGTEGGFHLCTAWLIHAFLMVGRRDDATDLFRQLVTLAGPTGLFSEQFGPSAELSLGNHPQAYSHLALIECALALANR